MKLNTAGLKALALAACSLLWSGCMQLEVVVEMHEKDAGATVRERIRVSRTLQEVCPTKADLDKLLAHLSEQSARERTKQMGKGITLVSHERKELPNGSVESRAVYEIPNIRDLRINNPFVAFRPPASGASISYGLRMYLDKPTNETWLNVHEVNKKLKYPEAMVRRTATPRERQILRELRPIVSDMMSDFQATVRLKVPTQFKGGYVRNIRAGRKTTTLFSLTGDDLDKHGRGFLENEEILIALLEMDFGDPAILGHTAAFPNNSRTPVLRAHGHGLRAPNRFRILQTTHQKETYSKKKSGK